MKRRDYNPILIFILAQVAWLTLVGLWIFWYVSNYIILADFGETVISKFVFNRQNVIALIGGLFLLVTISTGMTLIFGTLYQQIKVTQMYDAFIANVTHELKSPLASIQLYLETMNAREVPDAKRREFINLMIQDADRLNSLISSILEISGLEERKTLLRNEVFPANELVRELVGDAADQYRLPAKAIEIQGTASRHIRADRNAIKTVFNNLIDNAIKYSLNSVHITISLSDTSRHVLIEVTDRGIGIPRHDQKDVFKKFRRLTSPQSPSVKGTGLGLYRVKEIIRQHRGNVSVNSEGLNKGSTFRIRLPVYHPGGREGR